MTIRLFRTGPGPIAGFLFACVLCFGLQAQSSGNTADTADAADSAVGDETAIVLGAGESPESLDNDAGETPTVFLLLRVVLVLAVVCAGIYGVIWLLKKSTRINAARDPYLRMIAQLPLSQNTSARVISVGTQAFLVGVTDQSVNLIAEITDKELIDAMNLEAERDSSEPVGPFEGVLARFLPNLIPTGSFGAKKANASAGEASRATDETREDGASASITADFIRRQRERLAQVRSTEDDSEGGAR